MGTPHRPPIDTMETFDARTNETDQNAGPVSLTDAVNQIVAEEHAAAAAAAAVPSVDTSKPRVIEPVAIQLDRERLLSLPFWAIRRFQKKTGLSAWDHDRVWGFPPDPDVIVHLVWAALLEEDESLTVEQVERFPNLDLANMLYVRGRLDKLWGEVNPPPDAPGEQPGTNDPNAVAATSTG